MTNVPLTQIKQCSLQEWFVKKHPSGQVSLSNQNIEEGCNRSESDYPFCQNIYQPQLMHENTRAQYHKTSQPMFKTQQCLGTQLPFSKDEWRDKCFRYCKIH